MDRGHRGAPVYDTANKLKGKKKSIQPEAKQVVDISSHLI